MAASGSSGRPSSRAQTLPVPRGTTPNALRMRSRGGRAPERERAFSKTTARGTRRPGYRLAGADGDPRAAGAVIEDGVLLGQQHPDRIQLAHRDRLAGVRAAVGGAEVGRRQQAKLLLDARPLHSRLVLIFSGHWFSPGPRGRELPERVGELR